MQSANAFPLLSAAPPREGYARGTLAELGGVAG